MPDEEVEQREEDNEPGTDRVEEPTPAERRRFLTRRNVALMLGLTTLSVIILALVAVFLYRGGVADSYIKNQFTTKMADIASILTPMSFASGSLRCGWN